MKSIKLIIGVLMLTGSVSILAAEPRTENTFGLEEGEERPAATLEDAAFLVGNWTGTAFGSNFQAHWNPPAAGSMVGLFKLFNDEGVSFYEILQLSVEEGSLSLKVKHFHADFTAWEEKEDFINFRLVGKEENALHFGGLSFYPRDENNMDGYIVMRNGEELTEHHLKYNRVSN